MKHLWSVILLLLFTSRAAVAQIPAPTIPDFQFFKLDQTAFSNKDLTKDKMIFFILFDPDCEHCQRAVKSLSQQYHSFKKLSIYMVSIFDQNKIKQFLNLYGQNLQQHKNVVILQDKFNQFITRFKPRKYPSMFLYSAQKKLIDYEDDPDMMFKFIKIIGGK